MYKYLTKIEIAPSSHNGLASCELSCIQQAAVRGIPTLGEHDLMLHVIIPRLGFGYVHCTELDTFHNLLSEVSGSLFLIMGGVDSAHTYWKKTPNYESVKFYSNHVMSAIHTSLWYHQLYYFVSFCVYIHLVYMDVNTNNNSMDSIRVCQRSNVYRIFAHFRLSEERTATKCTSMKACGYGVL